MYQPALPRVAFTEINDLRRVNCCVTFVNHYIIVL